MKRRTVLSASTAAVALTGAGVASTYAWANSSPKSGEVREDLRMSSQMLGVEVAYSLYLPPGYEPANHYPVLFLMHGSSGDCLEWLRNCDAQATLDAAIAEERLPATVVAFGDSRRDVTQPSGDQELTYNMNDADGEFRYADMFVEEFVPFVENEYSAGGDRDQRAIGGLSMGGFGALSFAMRSPEMFSSAFGLSIGARTDQQMVEMEMEQYNWRFARSLGRDLAGEDRLNDHYRHWNLVDVIGREDPGHLGKTPYYLDCGEEDTYLPGNTMVAEALGSAEIPHEFSTHPGAHDHAFWAEALPRALNFTATHLAK